MEKIRNIADVYTLENESLRNAKEKAIKEVIKSLADHTFFDKFVHRSLSNDFFHIVEFLPFEFFLEHKNVLMVKEEARNYFLAKVEEVNNVADFISVVKAREEFARSLESRVKRAKKLTVNEMLDIAQNLEQHKLREVNKINTCFSTLAYEIHKSAVVPSENLKNHI